MGAIEPRQKNPEEMQVLWQTIGQRLRELMLKSMDRIDIALSTNPNVLGDQLDEGEESLPTDKLAEIAAAAMHIMAIEERAASMAYRINKDSGETFSGNG